MSTIDLHVIQIYQTELQAHDLGIQQQIENIINEKMKLVEALAPTHAK